MQENDPLPNEDWRGKSKLQEDWAEHLVAIRSLLDPLKLALNQREWHQAFELISRIGEHQWKLGVAAAEAERLFLNLTVEEYIRLYNAAPTDGS